MSEPEKAKRKLPSLSTMIFISLVLGVFVGVFLGEYAAKLQFIGDGFIRLLQMTILPYITISLITGIGGLSLVQAKQLAARLLSWLGIFWAIGLVFFLGAALTFPEWQSASFFSTSLVTPKDDVNFLEMYIPANPFNSLANSVIPAVVIFSLSVGVALITIPGKQQLIDNLQILTKALTLVTNVVVRLTPLGVFAISASAAGTMTVDDFSKLQVYLVSFNVIAVLMSFIILPFLVAAVTPFGVREVIRVSRDALITGFTTGNLFIILPILTEEAKRLFEAHKQRSPEVDAYSDVIIPVSFNFPNLGKLIMLIFVLFAGWFSGNTITLADYPLFIFTGVFSFFGSVDVAIPYMLELYDIPTDLYQFYLVTGIINGRFATLLAAMNLLAFTLIVTCAVTGKLQIQWKRIASYGGSAAAISLVTMIAIGAYFRMAVNNEYIKDELLVKMHLMQSGIEPTVFKEAPEAPPLLVSRETRLERIQKDGILRVGYLPHRLPFAFENSQEEIVGFDVDMMALLANQLECELHLIPTTLESAPTMLERGEIDITIGGMAINTKRLEQMQFTNPYLDLTFAFVVREKNQQLFSDVSTLKKEDGIKIAVTRDSYFKPGLQKYLPDAEIIEIETYQDFFDSKDEELVGLLASAQTGSAWTLLYPNYSVVIPGKEYVSMPIAYGIPKYDQEWLNFMQSWVELTKRGGTYKRLYNYWILGEGSEEIQPRWSIMRNVLGWVE